MICTQVTLGGPGVSGQYKLVLLVDTASSYGSIATAAVKLGEFLSGISFFGYQFDRSLLGGWDVTKIEYATDRIEIFLSEVGSIGILALISVIWPYLVWVLRFLGIVLLGNQLINLGNNVIEAQETNAEREQDKQRALCIQTQLNAGKTEAEAIKICQVSYPQREGTDWDMIFVGVAAILGAAYIFGGKK